MGAFITALTMVSCLMACSLLRIHTYLIPAKMAPRWITIEYDNPKCAPLRETAFGREFVIPESGFLCTSSAMYEGWHREEYYLVDENNNRIALRVDERIFRRGSFTIKQPSTEPGMNVCNLTGEEFFYGPKEKLTYENPIRQDEGFLTQYHPECRSREISAKPSP